MERRYSPTREQLLSRIRAEFREMPCLRLTGGQAQRLFGMPADVCARVLQTLVREGTLACGPDERYGMPDALRLHAALGNRARAAGC